MDDDRKLKLTFLTIGVNFLLNGVEYAVILPTIWMYLQSLEAEPFFLGLTLSAFSLSGLLFGPLFGFWSDRTHTTKNAILMGVVFEIAGNLMYFMGSSKWVLLSSRFVAGVGAGVGSSIFGFLTRVTAPGERATVFAAVMACRQAGLVIGPAFNIFLRLCDVQLGPFVLNKFTSPGLFMCLLWILYQLLVIFMYWDVPPQEARRARHRTGRKRREKEEEEEEEEEARGVSEDEEEGDEEEKPLIGCQELSESYGSVRPIRDTHTKSNGLSDGNHRALTHTPPPLPPLPPPSSPPSSLPPPSSPPSSPPPVSADSRQPSSPFQNFSLSREFLREEVVVLLAAQFITLFNQTALETMVTPMTQKYFNFGELENSIMYFLGGAVIIACFLFVRWLSRRLEERVVLAVGLAICNVACVWFLIFLTDPQGTFGWQMAKFVIGFFLQVVGLPFVAVAQVSLFSKVTSAKTQGFCQGVRRSVGGLATILGPLWAGGLTQNLYVMMGVMMGLLLLLMVMLAFSYKRLVEPRGVEQPPDAAERC